MFLGTYCKKPWIFWPQLLKIRRHLFWGKFLKPYRNLFCLRLFQYYGFFFWKSFFEYDCKRVRCIIHVIMTHMLPRLYTNVIVWHDMFLFKAPSRYCCSLSSMSLYYLFAFLKKNRISLLLLYHSPRGSKAS